MGEMKRQTEGVDSLPRKLRLPCGAGNNGHGIQFVQVEGYPNRRYYGGQEFDNVGDIGINRAKQLFNAGHTNVQPHAGAPANVVHISSPARAGRHDYGHGF